MKAVEISQKMGIDFKYSKGWPQQFKEGWNITFSQLAGKLLQLQQRSDENL